MRLSPVSVTRGTAARGLRNLSPHMNEYILSKREQQTQTSSKIDMEFLSNPPCKDSDKTKESEDDLEERRND